MTREQKVWQEIEAAADQQVRKSGWVLTPAEAVDNLLAAEPALYARYVAAQAADVAESTDAGSDMAALGAERRNSLIRKALDSGLSMSEAVAHADRVDPGLAAVAGQASLMNSGSGGSAAYAELANLATARLNRDPQGTSFEQAMSAVLNTDAGKRLYAAYLAEGEDNPASDEGGEGLAGTVAKYRGRPGFEAIVKAYDAAGEKLREEKERRGERVRKSLEPLAALDADRREAIEKGELLWMTTKDEHGRLSYRPAPGTARAFLAKRAEARL